MKNDVEKVKDVESEEKAKTLPIQGSRQTMIALMKVRWVYFSGLTSVRYVAT